MRNDVTVLVAEDDEHIAQMLEQMLPRWFGRVVVVRSFEAAVVVLRSVVFDAVLADYELPDGNGTELLRLVAELLPNARRILWSGKAAVNIDPPQLAHIFLPKPVGLKSLQEALTPPEAAKKSAAAPDPAVVTARLENASDTLAEFKASIEYVTSQLDTLTQSVQRGEVTKATEDDAAFKESLRDMAKGLLKLADLPLVQLDALIKERIADARMAVDELRGAIAIVDERLDEIRRAWEGGNVVEISAAQKTASNLRDSLMGLGQSLIGAAANLDPLCERA